MIALSTTKAKYMEATHITKTVIWLHNLFKDIRFLQHGSIIIFNNNQNYISLSKNHMFYAYITSIRHHMFD